MRLVHRILLAPLVAIIAMLIIGGVGYWALDAEHDAIGDLFDVRFAHSSLAGETRSGVLQAQARVYRVMTWAERSEGDFVDRETRTLLADFDRIAGRFATWTSGLNNAEEAELGRSMTQAIKAYREAIVAALDMASADMNAGVMAMQTADDRFKVLSGLADRLVAFQEAAGRKDVDSANALYERVTLLAAMVLLLSIVLSATVAMVVSRQISQRLGGEPEYAATVVRRIAGGDLSARIDVPASDRDSLLAGMRDMQQALCAVIGQIRQAAEQLIDAAQAQTVEASRMATGSAQQNDATSAVAAAIEELSSSIAQVADSAESAQARATESGAQASVGASLVRNTIDGIHQIARSVEQSSQVVKHLGEDSEKITGIVQTIKEIADQTNLLALNAAIEAARAGEQGRGFAVVADEVRKLAEKTAASTQEIGQMITSIQGGTREAVHGMEGGAAQVRNGISVAGNAGDAMARVADETATVRASIDEISNALREQRTASEQIAQNIQRIAMATEENSDGVNRISAAANGLQQLAGELKTAISRFRL